MVTSTGFAESGGESLALALACDLTNTWPDDALREKSPLQIRLAANLRARIESEKAKGAKKGQK